MTQKIEDKKVAGNATTPKIAPVDLSSLAKKAKELDIPYLKDIPTITEDVLKIISHDVSIEHHIVAFEKNGKKYHNAFLIVQGKPEDKKRFISSLVLSHYLAI